MKSLGWIVLGLSVLAIAAYAAYRVGPEDLEWRVRTEVLRQSPAIVVLEPDASAAGRGRLEEAADAMATALNQAQPRISFAGRGVVDGAARVRVVELGDLPRAREIIAAALIQGFSYSEDEASGVISLRPNAPSLEAGADALARTVEVLRARLRASGMTSRVALEGRRITAQVLDLNNPEQIAPLLVMNGRLTFNLVSERSSTASIPPGYRVAQGHPLTQAPAEVVRRRAAITGHIASASPSFAVSGEPVVSFRFDEQGGRLLCRVTRENTGKRFAILLDDQVITAPSINEPICGGTGQITGNFTVQSARELALVLSAGELPVALTVVEMRTPTSF